MEHLPRAARGDRDSSQEPERVDRPGPGLDGRHVLPGRLLLSRDRRGHQPIVPGEPDAAERLVLAVRTLERGRLRGVRVPHLVDRPPDGPRIRRASDHRHEPGCGRERTGGRRAAHRRRVAVPDRRGRPPRLAEGNARGGMGLPDRELGDLRTRACAGLGIVEGHPGDGRRPRIRLFVPPTWNRGRDLGAFRERLRGRAEDRFRPPTRTVAMPGSPSPYFSAAPQSVANPLDPGQPPPSGQPWSATPSVGPPAVAVRNASRIPREYTPSYVPPPYGYPPVRFQCPYCAWVEAKYDAGRFTCTRCGRTA